MSGCDEGVQANQFLIVTKDHAALIDPGGNLSYSRLFMAVSDYVNPKNIDFVIASHQDPDIVGSLNKWLKVNISPANSRSFWLTLSNCHTDDCGL